VDRDLLTILALSLGSCAVVAGLATLLLHRVRRASLTTLLVVAGLVPLAALALATAVNVRAMFLSAHDSLVTTVLLAASVPVSVLTALLLGRWVARGSGALVEAVERLGDEDDDTGLDGAAVPRELSVVAAELARARARLTAARRRERRVAEGHRELMAFLSHDLRTPLAGIRALAEGLEDGVVQDVPGALAELSAAAERLDGMVSDLFELSRSADAPPAAARTLVSLQEVVDDVAGGLQQLGRARRVDLRLDVPDRLPVLAEPDSLGRAVANLLDNALRHTPEGGSVTVTGRLAATGEIVLSVRDECGGIAEPDLARVFDVGWRADRERGTRSGSGAGLGLAIVRQVVAAHDGAVGVRNLDGGCQFDVVLPPPAGRP